MVFSFLSISWSLSIYKNKEPKKLNINNSSVPLKKECETTTHFSLNNIPYGWSSSANCRSKSIFFEATSSDYTTESDATPESGYYGNLFLVKGMRFSIASDPNYPTKECITPSTSAILYTPITEKEIIKIDGYEGSIAHVQERPNYPSPAIDYYYIRIPIPDAPCQMIDFVSTVSTSTNNKIELQKFLSNLKLIR